MLRDAGLVLLIGLLGAVAIVLLPVIAPVIGMTEWIGQRRKRIAASRTACTRCGRLFGVEALDEADRIWWAGIRAIHEAHPGMRLLRRRLPERTLHAVCLRCGAQYRYDAPARTFRLEADAPEHGH